MELTYNWDCSFTLDFRQQPVKFSWDIEVEFFGNTLKLQAAAKILCE